MFTKKSTIQEEINKYNVQLKQYELLINQTDKPSDRDGLLFIYHTIKEHIKNLEMLLAFPEIYQIEEDC